MLLPPSVKIYLALKPLDMRRGIDSLAYIVKEIWAQDPFTGHLFLFISKSRNRAKILFWDRGGFVLYYKRLAKGRFRLPKVAVSGENITIDSTELAMLLDGLDYGKVCRPRRWEPPTSR